VQQLLSGSFSLKITSFEVIQYAHLKWDLYNYILYYILYLIIYYIIIYYNYTLYIIYYI